MKADINKIPNLASNGFVKTSGLDGTLTVDTNTYLTGNQTITLSGDVTGSGATAITTTIANDAVTYAKIQNVTTNRLLGRATAGSGDVEEITLGSGLSFTGTTLNVTAGTGDVVGPASAVNNNVVLFDGTTGKLIKDSGLTLAGSNTGDVTLAGTPDYITIAGQVITRGLIDLATDITGDLPFANLTQGSARSVLGVTGNATADVASIQGTANQVLRVDSAGTGLAFGQLNLASASAVTGFLPIGNIVSTAGAPSTQFLRGDGTWAVPAGSVSGSGVANQITYWSGTSTLTGNAAFTITSATGLMTVTGGHTVTQTVQTGTLPVTALTLTGAAHTTITASTEWNPAYFNFGQTVQYATGTLANSRTLRIAAQTLSAVGASTVTEASTVWIGGSPVAGTNATISASYGLQIAPTNPGAGVTLATGLLVRAPTGGTAYCAAQFRGGGVNIGLTGNDSRAQLNIYNDNPTGVSAHMVGIWCGVGQTGRMIHGQGTNGAAFYVEPTGEVLIAGSARTSGQPNTLLVTPAQHQTLQASTDQHDIYFNFLNSKQFSTGAKSLQRDFRVTQRTYTAVASTTVTMAATVGIDGPPIKSTNITLTDTTAIYIGGGSSVSSASRAWGLYVTASTGGSFNYAAYFGASVGINRASSLLASLDVVAGSSSTIALNVAGAASQSVDLVNVTTSTPTTVFKITNTGNTLHSPIASGGTVIPEFQVTIPAHTALTASTEHNAFYVNQSASLQWNAGTLATQRFAYFTRPTIAFVSASTATDSATVAIEGHVAVGTNATLTNSYALWIQGASGNGTNTYGLRVDNPTGSNTINRALLVRSSFSNGTPLIRFQGTSSATNPVLKDTVHEDVSTTDATVSNILVIGTASDTAYTVVSIITARQTGGIAGTAGHQWSYQLMSGYRNIAGVLTKVNEVLNVISEDDAAFTVGSVASGTNIVVQVTGAANKNVLWHIITDYYTVNT